MCLGKKVTHSNFNKNFEIFCRALTLDSSSQDVNSSRKVKNVHAMFSPSLSLSPFEAYLVAEVGHVLLVFSIALTPEAFPSHLQQASSLNYFIKVYFLGIYSRNMNCIKKHQGFKLEFFSS